MAATADSRIMVTLPDITMASRPCDKTSGQWARPRLGACLFELEGVERQGYLHGCATLRRTVDRNLAVVRLDEPFGRGQAQASAA
jgi:hypothetical protein